MMTFRVFAILGLAFAAADSACAADLYKCVKDGRTSYQSAPCEAASQTTQIRTAADNSLPGCYVADISGFENGFQVKRAGSAGFTLETSSGKDKQSLPMKVATPEELHDVGAAFHMKLREGVSLKWNKGTPNQKPVGLYKGQDATGKEVVLAYFFLANGLATATQCK